MLTTVDELKKQIFTDDEDDPGIERIIKSVSAAIETYCRRDFSKEYTLPSEPELDEKPRLPYDVEDACILWCTYRYEMGGKMGVSSERIDGLGQRNYTRMATDSGQLFAAPPSVLALIDPYRRMIYS